MDTEKGYILLWDTSFDEGFKKSKDELLFYKITMKIQICIAFITQPLRFASVLLPEPFSRTWYIGNFGMFFFLLIPSYYVRVSVKNSWLSGHWKTDIINQLVIIYHML